jgi:acyl-CoA thioester hydrolase
MLGKTGCRQVHMEIKPLLRKANFYETDQMGVIHHANYIRWFEEARVDYMDQMGYGYEKSNQAGIDFALTGLSCEYKSPVRFGQAVIIEAGITLLTPSRMAVAYTVTDAATGALRTVGETRHCYFDREKQRPVSLKKVLPELYERLVSTRGRPEEAGG